MSNTNGIFKIEDCVSYRNEFEEITGIILAFVPWAGAQFAKIKRFDGVITHINPKYLSKVNSDSLENWFN